MKKTFGFLSLISVLLATGCSHQEVSDNGFVTTTLSDGAVFGQKSVGILKDYDSLYLKSVTALPAPGIGQLDSADMAALEYSFEDAFKSTMGDTITLVNEPGANTLTVVVEISEVRKSTITRVTGNNIADQINTRGTSASRDVSNAQIAGTVMSVHNAQINVDFSNTTGELIANYKDGNFGADIENDSTGTTSWARVSAAMNQWCNDLEQELIEARKTTPSS